VLKTNLIALAFSIGMAMLAPGVVIGQEYPNKPIRIVTSPSGGGQDFAARLVVQGVSGPLGQPIIVENRPSNLLGEIVAKAAPDGYTLLLAGTSFMIDPLLKKTPYDPVKDFSPISLLVSSPSVLAVHPSLPVKTVKDLIGLAKARPGELNYAMGGTGSSSHLAAELFKSMAGVDIVRITYKGTAAAVTDVIGGQVQMVFATAPSVAPHLKSGRLRGMAVTSARPTALAANLPAVAATLPGYEAESIQGMFAPAKTADAIIRRLNAEFVRFLRTPEVKERFFAAGSDVVASTPAQLDASVKGEIARLGKVIKDADIRLD